MNKEPVQSPLRLSLSLSDKLLYRGVLFFHQGGLHMYTSILMLALSGVAPTAEVVDTPAWVTDYGAARKQAASTNKPLVVVLSPGAKSWEKLSREGTLSSEALKAFKDRYICVFINTATEEGKSLATAFEMPSGLGIVMSDRTGNVQAF